MMVGISLTFLGFCLQAVIAADRDSSGDLNVMEACTIKPDEKTCSFVSQNFPSPAPHKMYQVGKFSCYGKLSDTVAFKLDCPTLEIVKEKGDCEFPLELEDESRFKPKQFCGDHSGLKYTSKRSDITIRMETGKQGGGRVNCTATCVHLDRFGNEIATTPDPFLINDFVEIDSSEHGSLGGVKKTSCPCGNANKITSRIINGTETGQNEYPWIAALVEREDLFPYCGAAIITEWHVLTAAHCTANQMADKIPLAIRVGSHNLRKDPNLNEVINVAKIIVHNDYQPANYFKNDISLLILEKQIQFGPYVSRVCLPQPRSQPYSSNVKIIGWGLTKPGDEEGSPVLRQVDVKLVTMDQCKIKYPRLDIIIPTQLCTYRLMHGSCQGDSGGPVVWVDPETNRYTLVGLVSFGKVCGDTNPTVHTDISYYLPWIQRYINIYNPAESCTKI